MKECLICNSIFEDSLLDCPSCGKSLFKKVSDNSKPVIRPYKVSSKKEEEIKQTFKVRKLCITCKTSYDPNLAECPICQERYRDRARKILEQVYELPEWQIRDYNTKHSERLTYLQTIYRFSDMFKSTITVIDVIIPNRLSKLEPEPPFYSIENFFKENPSINLKKLPPDSAKAFTDHVKKAFLVEDQNKDKIVIGEHEYIGITLTTILELTTAIIALITAIISFINILLIKKVDEIKKANDLQNINDIPLLKCQIHIKIYKHGELIKEKNIIVPIKDLTKDYLKKILKNGF